MPPYEEMVYKMQRGKMHYSSLNIRVKFLFFWYYCTITCLPLVRLLLYETVFWAHTNSYKFYTITYLTTVLICVAFLIIAYFLNNISHMYKN